MIQAAENKTTLIYRDGSTTDIIKGLLSVTPQAVEQLKDFAKRNYNGNTLDYIRKTANYIQNNFRYLKDGTKNQNIQLPARLNQDRAGDCKSFSLFFSAAMTAAGIPNGFRFISYDGGPPTHVYNYVQLNGKKIPVDTCLKDFFSETKHKSQMNVNVLSGPEYAPEIGRRSRAERKEKRAERKENRQERRSGRKENRQEKRAGRKEKRKENRPFKKVALAPARGAMLLLVSLNVRNWAVKLSKMKPDDVSAFWKRVGGDPDKLFDKINTGKAKRRILGPEDQDEFLIETIGEPVTATTALATAAPIVLALVKLFRSKGVGDQDDAKTEQEVTEAGVEPLGEGFQATDPQPGSENESAGFSRTDSGGSGSGAGTGSGGGGLLLPLAIGTGIFLLAKK